MLTSPLPRSLRCNANSIGSSKDTDPPGGSSWVAQVQTVVRRGGATWILSYLAGRSELLIAELIQWADVRSVLKDSAGVDVESEVPTADVVRVVVDGSGMPVWLAVIWCRFTRRILLSE